MKCLIQEQQELLFPRIYGIDILRTLQRQRFFNKSIIQGYLTIEF